MGLGRRAMYMRRDCAALDGFGGGACGEYNIRTYVNIVYYNYYFVLSRNHVMYKALGSPGYNITTGRGTRANFRSNEQCVMRAEPACDVSAETRYSRLAVAAFTLGNLRVTHKLRIKRPAFHRITRDTCGLCNICVYSIGVP